MLSGASLFTGVASGLWPIIGAFVAGLAIVVVLRRDREHRSFTRKYWAATRGYTYTASAPSLTGFWPGLPFTSGGSALNVITGTTAGGHPFCSFRYQVAASRRTFRYDVTAIRMPAVLPALCLTREPETATLGDGGQPVRLESESFNDQCHLVAVNVPFAYRALPPRLVTWLLGPGRALRSWRFDGAYLLTWQRGWPDHARLPGRLELLDELVRQVPP
ncbi:MAG: hypothetical protein LBI33_01400, partial [Propionibacteriaceae bacterium]|nr:hypothetical protein [Propionibacteriaceae bacterium]